MRWSRAALSLLTLLAVAACGVPAQDEPHEVTLPRRPLTATSPSPAESGSAGEVAEVLCLVRDGSLAQAVRRVSGAPTAQRQLTDLVAGPTATERQAGLSSALAGTSLTVRVGAAGGGAVVEVAEPDAGSGRSDELLGYAQIVCTLTSRADIGSVVFTQGGQPLRVPRGDGSLSDGPLTGADYRELIGP
ncbi:hypothetical protein ADL15_48450 [Actinoplanes awajinensis subsp. mycoplanecinus]|uniref:GerMN domain-containing protein n=2 Tax=Actinoplanes awajinensis TaxID=135946 RepID=A0A117MKI8_9ACTN|nr:hypothetical protein ADL15_48450 [Actinoplanes awajinensis subsp. mycoplanecinus]